jgi:hypothetical protein
VFGTANSATKYLKKATQVTNTAGISKFLQFRAMSIYKTGPNLNAVQSSKVSGMPALRLTAIK